MPNNAKKPLVFACAGCSFAGKLAWDLAKELDRREIAEMSCLAGVGAQKKPFMRQLQNREVWVIDGCPIHCGEGIFDHLPIKPQRHIRLHDFGIAKISEPQHGVDMNALIDWALQQPQMEGA